MSSFCADRTYGKTGSFADCIQNVEQLFSSQHAEGSLRGFVEDAQQCARCTSRTALSLLPVAYGLLGHIDTPRKFCLREAKTPTHPASVSRCVLQCLLLVFPLLLCDLGLGGGIHSCFVYPPFWNSGRGLGINYEVRCIRNR